MKLAGMVLWVITAGIGGYLLAVGFAAQREVREARAVPVEVEEHALVMGLAAIPEDGPPATGGVRAPEGSPLLEFSHPALALTGLTFWIFYVVTDVKVFGWIGFGVVLAAIALGISWVLTGRRHAGLAGGFPGHLVLLHAGAAACTLALAAVSVLAVVHL